MIFNHDNMSCDTVFSIAVSKMYSNKSLGKDDNYRKIEREMMYHLNIIHPQLKKQTIIILKIITCLGEKLDLTSVDIRDLKEVAEVQDIGMSLSDDMDDKINNHRKKHVCLKWQLENLML